MILNREGMSITERRSKESIICEKEGVGSLQSSPQVPDPRVSVHGFENVGYSNLDVSPIFSFPCLSMSVSRVLGLNL